MLDVGDGNRVYWETCGNPRGKPARRPARRPRLRLHAVAPPAVRSRRPIASCCSTSGTAAAARRTPASPAIDLREQHDRAPGRGHRAAARAPRHRALAGVRRLVGQHAGARLRRAAPGPRDARWSCSASRPGGTARSTGCSAAASRSSSPSSGSACAPACRRRERDGDVVEAYSRLLHDPDPAVCQQAAEDWCLWESATPAWPPTTGLAPRFTDPAFALAFARIVTHYVRHNAWLEDGVLLRNAGVAGRTSPAC